MEQGEQLVLLHTSILTEKMEVRHGWVLSMELAVVALEVVTDNDQMD